MNRKQEAHLIFNKMIERSFGGPRTPEQMIMIVDAEQVALENDYQRYVVFHEMLVEARSLPKGKARAFCLSHRIEWERLGIWEHIINKLENHFNG